MLKFCKRIFIIINTYTDRQRQAGRQADRKRETETDIARRKTNVTDLNFGESGQRVAGNSMSYSCNSFISLKLFKTEKFKENLNCFIESN